MTSNPDNSESITGDGVLSVSVGGEEAVCDWRGTAYFPAYRLLVFSDLHLEKGSSFARRGSFIPPYDTHNTIKRVDQLIGDYDPKVVICLGDSFHDDEGHGRIPTLVENEIAALAHKRDWCWISGNHDPTAPSNMPGFAADEIAIGGLVFRHEPHEGPVNGEISGHLHPAARIHRRGRSVRRVCFARDGSRMIMPAFGAFTGSLNVLAEAYEGLFNWSELQALLLGDRRIYPIAATQLVPDRANVIKTGSRRRA